VHQVEQSVYLVSQLMEFQQLTMEVTSYQEQVELYLQQHQVQEHQLAVLVHLNQEFQAVEVEL